MKSIIILSDEEINDVRGGLVGYWHFAVNIGFGAFVRELAGVAKELTGKALNGGCGGLKQEVGPLSDTIAKPDFMTVAH